MPDNLTDIAKGLADTMKRRFTPPEFIPGCKVTSVADISQYATNNGWVEAICGQHNQQRCRWRGQYASIAVDDYIDVMYFPDRRLFEVHRQGGSGVLSATVAAGNITSGTATDGYVLTADGSGAADWEAAAGGDHNTLTGLQGGTTDEYYHLTAAEYGSLATGDVTGPGASTDHAVPRWDGTAGYTLQDSGVTIDDSDNITAPAEIYMGGGLGLKRRIIDNITATISDDFHFRSGSYPTGWSWQTTGIWNSPTSLEDNDFYGEYLAAYGGTCFFASTVTTYLNKSIYARFAPGGEIGLRLQADDTHYYQIRLKDLSTGLMQIYVDYDDGGGIVTATKTTFPIWQSVVCRLYCLQSGANHYGGFYLVNELGGGVVRFITAVKTWTPTQVGFISLTSGLGYVDWMSSDFT